MENLSSWDVGLLAVAGFVAVTSLVRLMQRQRKVVLNQLQRQVEQERAAQEAAEQKDKKKAAAATEKKPPKRAA